MPKTVLLADDSVTIQKVVGITFANEDVELVTENNGDAALARAREITPDLILADVSMPGLNGYELCAAIRSEPRLARIPVILLTGTFESFDEAKTAEVGADGHIAKPFEAQALVDLVRSTIERASRQPSAAPSAPAPMPASEVPSFAPPTPDAARAAAPTDPGRTEIVGLSPQEETPTPPSMPSFESPPPRVEASPPTPMPSFEPPAAQPATAAAADPGRTDIVGLNSPGEDQEPLQPPPAPPLEAAFADFDDEAPAGEATRVYDPAQAAVDAPLITPPAENAAPPLPSVDPAPSPSSAPPSPMPALATPDVSPDLPPSPAMGETPPRSSGLQGADTDVDAVLYGETAFLDPRAAAQEPPPSEPLEAPVFEAPPEPVAPVPEVVPSPTPPPVFPTGQAPQFDADDGQRTAVLPVDAVHHMNEETAPDPGREERAALAAAAALDDVSAPPPPLAEPPDLELSEPVVEPEPLALADADPLADDAEPLSMSHVEMLDAPPTAEIHAASEPAAPVAPPEPVAAPPVLPEPPELELDSPIIEQPEPVDAAEVHSALEKMAWDAFGPLSEQIVRDAVRKIEEIAWEVIPQLTEKLIRQEIARLKKDD